MKRQNIQMPNHLQD